MSFFLVSHFPNSSIIFWFVCWKCLIDGFSILSSTDRSQGVRLFFKSMLMIWQSAKKTRPCKVLPLKASFLRLVRGVWSHTHKSHPMSCYCNLIVARSCIMLVLHLIKKSSYFVRLVIAIGLCTLLLSPHLLMSW